MGCAGIVTNTVVHRQLASKYGDARALIEAYCRVTDLPVIVEIEGESTEALLRAADAFLAISSQIGIKITCTPQGLRAFRVLADRGVETMATTLFSLNQVAAAAAAGATHLLPFCTPHEEIGADSSAFVRRCVRMFSGRDPRPLVTASLVRSAAVAQTALDAGADGVIVFTGVLDEMLQHPLTDQWNKVFADNWKEMEHAGQLESLLKAGVA